MAFVRRVAVVAGPVVVALVAGFLLGRLTADRQPPIGPPAGAPPIDLGREGRYIALGDSYSAGEGLPAYEPGTEDVPDGDRCHRSLDYAYPVQLVFVHATEPVHRACSGAVVENVFRTVQRHDGVADGQGHQVESDTLSPPVVLVTITMGGNDVRFADMLIFCAKHKTCVDNTFEGEGTLEAFAEDHLRTVGEDLPEMYAELRARTPSDARILVLGYPGLFPESVPPLFTDPFCHSVFGVFGESERTAIREWNVRLNEEVHAAANEAGVEFVDVYTFFSQHEVCGRGGAWIKFVGDPSRQERDGWFHPTRTGQTMMARIVSCYLHVYRSAQQATAADPGDTFEMSSCVANTYPTGDPIAPISLPTPAPAA